MDCYFKSEFYLSDSNKISKISLKITFKNCDDYDFSSISDIENTVITSTLKDAIDIIYSKLQNKNYVIYIDVSSDNNGLIKKYIPENISVIVDKNNNPKGIILNDNAEVYNINNLPENIKTNILNILGIDNNSSNANNPIQPVPAPPPSNTEHDNPSDNNVDKEDKSQKREIDLSPNFDDIFQSTLKKMDGIKPSDDLLNEVSDIGGDKWRELKTKIESSQGDSNGSNVK